MALATKMTLRARIANWQGWSKTSNLRSWQGWRRYAPAAGSVGAHIVVGGAIIWLVAATSLPPMSTPHILEVTLMPEAETPPPMPTPPTQAPARPRAVNEPDAEALPTLPPTARKPEKKPSATQPLSTTSAIASTESEGVFLPPSPYAPGAVGLASLTADPCKTTGKLQVKDCDTRLSKISPPKYYEEMTKEEKARYYAEYVPICPYKVGCDGGPWRGNNGTHSVYSYNGSPMMSGAGGLGGINELVGRLGFNPDHTDPGFGD